MPVIFICFIVFIIWFRVKSKQSDKANAAPEQDFWKREQEANFTRKKDISDLDYIIIPDNALPFTDTDDDEEISLQNNIKKLMSKKIVNLSNMTNTDIKLTYGYANLEILSEYDQNYTLLLRSLSKWGTYLYNKGDKEHSRQILEYALSIKSDITETYTTLAKIYLDMNEFQKVQSLIDNVENSGSFMKDSIAANLKRLIQEY